MLNALTQLAAEAPEHYGPPPWWPVFPLFWFLAILTVAIVVTRMRRRRWGACGYGPRRAGGLDRLAERYAAGEIDETEYRNRREVLEEQYDRRR